MGAGTIVEHFTNLEDPRTHLLKNRHKLMDMIVIAICGVPCGADDWVAISEFGGAKLRWFKTFLELPNGIPSHDTFRRVFSLLDPKRFEECFAGWIRSVAWISQAQIIAVDGKTLRRSHDSDTAPIHMVSAWADGSRLVLGQVRTEEKSNEINAIPELLRLLDLHGCIVTTDSMGCQKKIAQQIIEQGGDYVLGLKGNQPSMLEAVEEIFSRAKQEGLEGSSFDSHHTEENGHGRHEIRTCFTTSLLDQLPDAQRWAGLKTIGALLSNVTRNGQTTMECRYYISSLENNAQLFAKAVRSHWGIENACHWVLDMAFREDESKVRKDHAPENLAVLRHIALNLLREEKTAKIGPESVSIDLWQHQWFSM